MTSWGHIGQSVGGGVLDDFGDLEVGGLQLLPGLQLPLGLDAVPPVDQGPHPGVDRPVDVLGPLALVGARGLGEAVPSLRWNTVWNSLEPSSSGYIHGLGHQGVGLKTLPKHTREGLSVAIVCEPMPDLLQTSIHTRSTCSGS